MGCTVGSQSPMVHLVWDGYMGLSGIPESHAMYGMDIRTSWD